MKLLEFMGHKVALKVNKYPSDGYLSIELVSYEREAKSTELTVTLKDDFLFELFPEEDRRFIAFVNTSNICNVETFIRIYNLGRFTGFYGPAGWSRYPLYAFNENRLSLFDPKGVEKFKAFF